MAGRGARSSSPTSCIGRWRNLSASFLLLLFCSLRVAFVASDADFIPGPEAQGMQFSEEEANKPAGPPTSLVNDITRANGRTGPPPPTNSWGIVQTRKTQFITPDRKNFYVNGYNSWGLAGRGGTPEGRQRVINLLDAGQALGLTVVRIMAGNLGAFVVQSGPSNFSETALRDFDWLMNECSKRQIRLLVMFGNNWSIKLQYQSWLPANERGTSEDVFYTNPRAKSWFKGLLSKVITRNNTVNGIKYSDDPTVFGWQLLNEPRCNSDKTGASLISWTSEMAAFVKSLDRKHMVSIGSEGFYGPSLPQRVYANSGPGWPAEQGNDFVAEHRVANIDFVTVHLYAQLWMGETDDAKFVFADKWLKAHLQDGRGGIKKPMLIEEFGWMTDIPKRDLMFRQVFAYSLNATKAGYSAGTLFWSFEDHDGTWNVNFNTHASTLKIVKEHSDNLRKLSR
ncbi:hypothetical protein CBR_g17068 [Chara braunii]|uniref:mannan endo-1,4-beta-mannosidase n=1 Tax=Chara braunii TaxID=69332 RepID=A0A388KUQ0_CHABU|nr:hypothetical protein CBR_g17068 [Chara braunii]|eukprot:GBG73728.1 hypothetical protein CBR_g17068 [Chara braunii]